MLHILGWKLTFPSSKSIRCLTTNRKHCMELVKKADYNNYLCALMLPQPQQRFAFALRAFNVEISLVKDRAPTPEAASLRYRYWLDSLNNIISRNMPNHASPIEQELSWATGRFKLSRHWLTTLLQTRERQVDGVPFASFTDLERYADMTNSPIHYLIAESFDVRSLDVDHALSHLGKAQGLLTHIRSIAPLAARHRTILVPTEVLIKHNISAESLLRLCYKAPAIDDQSESVKKLKDVCYDLASLAHAHAMKAISCRENNQPHLLSNVNTEKAALNWLLLGLPLVPVCSLLGRLSKAADFDPRHASLFKPDGLMPFRIAWANWRRRIPTPPL